MSDQGRKRDPGQRPPAQPFEKPRILIKRGEEARALHEEQEQQRLTFAGVMIRLLPIWALLLMILIIAPSLPFRAIGAILDWAVVEAGAPTAFPTPEPVYIVEGGGPLPPDPGLPTPDWPMEIAPFFSREVQYWREDILAWSLIYRVEPNQIATLIQIESCGDPRVASGAGAQGLFQVMPLHFAEGEDMLDPQINAGRGLSYFAEVLALANGDVGLAFAAYNGGPGVIFQSPADWPQETQYYQFWGSGIYEEAAAGLSSSPTLSDWLDRGGGAALCDRASTTLGLR